MIILEREVPPFYPPQEGGTLYSYKFVRREFPALPVLRPVLLHNPNPFSDTSQNLFCRLCFSSKAEVDQE